MRKVHREELAVLGLHEVEPILAIAFPLLRIGELGAYVAEVEKT
jgi:hypothetical protein